MELGIPSASPPVGLGTGSHRDAGGSSAMLSPSFLLLGKPAERRLSSAGVGEGEPCPASGYTFHPLFIEMEISAAAWLAALRQAGAGEMQVEDGGQRRGEASCTAGRDAGGGPVVFPCGFPLRNPRKVRATGCTRQAAGAAKGPRGVHAVHVTAGQLKGAKDGRQPKGCQEAGQGVRAARPPVPAGARPCVLLGGQPCCNAAPGQLPARRADAVRGAAAVQVLRGLGGVRVCECVHVCVCVFSSLCLQA